jgi:hypothetical protein
VKLHNRFYIASQSVTSPSEQGQVNVLGDRILRRRWTSHTIDDAIVEATQLLDRELSRDHVAICQIVRIVRRAKTPVVIEIIE